MKFGLINDLLEQVEKVITGVEATHLEKKKLKSEVNKLIFYYLEKVNDNQTSVILSEAKGNWLQKSWRPIVMLTFTLIIVIGMFAPLEILEKDSPFWSLLELGLGGYVIGRSAEKITNKVIHK